MDLRAVRGMKDILPEHVGQWHRLERTFRAAAERHGYAEVRTPLLEPTELFVRQIGESTDVVEKEMYSFERHGDALTVRPEGTAGVARAYVQNAVQGKEPVSRWYYLGPMFRAERPAKGRLRQFHQAGCELFGDPGPVCDAELIGLVAEVVGELGIGDYRIHVNSIGSKAAQARYREALRSHFAPIAGSLSEDSRRRLQTNPLRILDSKSPEDAAAIAAAPTATELLDGDDAAHFQGLCRYLESLELPFVVDPKLVRGLDYYTRTLFELRTTTDELGAQSALAGGGRYDGMVESLGGPAVPAIGFAMGLERLLALMPEAAAAAGPHCYLVTLGEPTHAPALRLASRLRQAGLRVELDARAASLKAKLRRADGLRASLCLLLGEGELARGVVTVKDLARHEQWEVSLEEAPRSLGTRLAEGPPPAGAGSRDG
ncbi:MAG: histidine--tRNA ligase [Polyangiaceae bacterium]|nr:histidine--tRNA ligase [Polyangiaceae bacterium]